MADFGRKGGRGVLVHRARPRGSLHHRVDARTKKSICSSDIRKALFLIWVLPTINPRRPRVPSEVR